MRTTSQIEDTLVESLGNAVDVASGDGMVAARVSEDAIGRFMGLNRRESLDAATRRIDGDLIAVIEARDAESEQTSLASKLFGER